MKVLMHDPTLQHRGQLPVLAGSAVIRNNDFSTWKLEINGNDQRSERFDAGWGIQVIDDYGNQILSGPAVSIAHDVSADNKRRDLIIEGVSDNIYLADSLIIPNPHEGAEANADLWKASGPAETVMRKIVNEQIGPGAPDDYRITNLTLKPSQARGKTVSVSERFTNILEVLQDQAQNAGLLFGVRKNGRVIEFGVSEPRDLIRAVRLTRHNGAVGKYRSERSAPEATEAIVGGAGSGATRKMWRVPYPVGDWGRRVTKFVDRQSTSDSNELQQAAENELEDKGEKASVTFDANEIQRLKYGRDFVVGDRITIDLDGSLIQDTLQIVELSWSEKGRTAQMQVGPTPDESKLNPANGALLDLYKKVWAEVRRNQTR